ncbi:hypothetical protein PRIPAC_97904 [Pristionchus pacificus]|uniref:Uncharacterized protein n=1 Tax=Pristionchus pacificus TaxID=54126 RepID=A0A2A6D340_PRIPA|nr:hypothetical protein PRIPAC_97904 [Pristionchus pacificus]|eukprot:PDM84703.1 hypothetical protein PRIPAC_33726 [Pristionchus pacificus]
MPHVKQAKTLDADKSDDSDNPLRLEGVVEEELGGVQLGSPGAGLDEAPPLSPLLRLNFGPFFLRLAL